MTVVEVNKRSREAGKLYVIPENDIISLVSLLIFLLLSSDSCFLARIDEARARL